MSLSIYIATASPLKKRYGLYYTDGRRYVNQKRNNNAGKCEFALWKLIHHFESKKALLTNEDIDASIRILRDSTDDLYIISSYYYSYMHNRIEKDECIQVLKAYTLKRKNNQLSLYIKTLVDEIKDKKELV